MISRLFALAALLVIAGPTPPPSETDQVVRIVGSVWEGPTGAPLPDVQVYVPGANIGAITRREGHYTINLDDRWVGREVTVRFERIGYASGFHMLVLKSGDNTVDSSMVPQQLANPVGISVTAGSAFPSSRAAPEVAASVQIVGRVTDASAGSPIPEAQVYLRGANVGSLTRGDGATESRSTTHGSDARSRSASSASGSPP